MPKLLRRSVVTLVSAESTFGTCLGSVHRVDEQSKPTAVRYLGRRDCDNWSRDVLNSPFRRTSILVVSTIAMISSCGDNTANQSALAPVSASESSTTVPVTDPVSSDAVAMSDGSVCTPLPPPTSVSPDQAVGRTACTCYYDLFSLEDPSVCYQLLPIRTWTHPSGRMATPGSKLDQLPIATIGFKPMLPSGLDVRAVSTADFGVSGTDPVLGRVIVAEVADDSLIGGELREQISITKALTGTVTARLTDDDPDNDATVVSAVSGDAIVRFLQDSTATKGQPPIEQLEWIADGVRFSVVVQLGPDAVLKHPTFDESISQFINSFAPLGTPYSALQAAPDNHRGSGAVGW